MCVYHSKRNSFLIKWTNNVTFTLQLVIIWKCLEWCMVNIALSAFIDTYGVCQPWTNYTVCGLNITITTICNFMFDTRYIFACYIFKCRQCVWRLLLCQCCLLKNHRLWGINVHICKLHYRQIRCDQQYLWIWNY